MLNATTDPPIQRQSGNPSSSRPGKPRRLDPRRLPCNMDKLHRIARSLTRSEHEAEELVQETFMQVLKAPRYINHDSDLPYLAATMRRAFYARKHLPVENVSVDDLNSDLPSGFDLDDAVHARMALEAIDALPESYREAIIAVDVVGLKYRDAAKLLGVPEGTVMSRLHRARQRIAERLRDRPQAGTASAGAS